MRGLSLLLGACGAVLALLAWQGLMLAVPPDAADASMAVRLGKACAALLPGACVLGLMVLAQMAGRFASGAFDPLAGRDTRFLLVNQRAIDNTVEQLAIFAPALLALASGAEGRQVREVVALGGVFAGARLLFWGGYLVAPLGRAPGMAATLATTLATLAAAVWHWLH